MERRPFFPVICLVLTFHIISSGMILPVFAHALSIGNPVSVLMSQLAASQNATLEFWLIVILFPYMIATIFFTCASDNHNRKIMVTRCLALSSLGYIFQVAGLSFSAPLITLIGMLFLAIGYVGTSVIVAYTLDQIQTQFKKLYNLAIIAAIIIAAHIPIAQLSNYLLFAHSIFTPITIALLALICNIISVLISIYVLPNTQQSSKIKNKLGIDDIEISLSALFSNKIFCSLLIVLALFQFSWGIFFQNIYYYMTHFHKFSQLKTDLYITYLCFSSSLILITIYPYVIRFFTLKKLVVCCLLLCTIGIILSALLMGAASQWLVATVIAAGSGMLIPSLWALLANQIDRGKQGIAIGMTGIIWAVTWTLSGALENFLNSFNLMFPLIASAIIMFFSACAICFVKLDYSSAPDNTELYPANN